MAWRDHIEEYRSRLQVGSAHGSTCRVECGCNVFRNPELTFTTRILRHRCDGFWREAGGFNANIVGYQVSLMLEFSFAEGFSELARALAP